MQEEKEEKIEKLLEDARKLWEEAMRLKDVNLRQASEKAWCSAYNATRALFLKETGNPEIPKDRGTRVKELVTNLGKPELYDQFASFQSSLHGACFYGGYCQPEEYVTELIEDVGKYLDEIETLIRE